jgi:hypothetical protein
LLLKSSVKPPMAAHRRGRPLPQTPIPSHSERVQLTGRHHGCGLYFCTERFK